MPDSSLSSTRENPSQVGRLRSWNLGIICTSALCLVNNSRYGDKSMSVTQTCILTLIISLFQLHEISRHVLILRLYCWFSAIWLAGPLILSDILNSSVTIDWNYSLNSAKSFNVPSSYHILNLLGITFSTSAQGYILWRELSFELQEIDVGTDLLRTLRNLGKDIANSWNMAKSAYFTSVANACAFLSPALGAWIAPFGKPSPPEGVKRLVWLCVSHFYEAGFV